MLREAKNRTLICPSCGEEISFSYEALPGYDILIQRWHCPYCNTPGHAEVLSDEQDDLEQEMWDEAASELDSVSMYQPYDDEAYSFTGTYHNHTITIQVPLNK